jgi:hypothetical protein
MRFLLLIYYLHCRAGYTESYGIQVSLLCTPYYVLTLCSGVLREYLRPRSVFTVERQVGTPLFLKKTAEPLGRTRAVANENQVGGSYPPDFQGSDN